MRPATPSKSRPALDVRETPAPLLNMPPSTPLDDSRVRHGVTPIHVVERGLKAYRDVLVLTFRSDGATTPLNL